jgi:acyl carrier protein
LQPALDRQSTRDAVSRQVLQILADMTSDWEIEFNGPIRESTSLIYDLTCESMDIVVLIMRLEHLFGRKGLPYEDLVMVDGRYVEDLTAADVISFLHRHLNS